MTFLRDYKKSNFISDFLLNDHDMNFILLFKVLKINLKLNENI